jgi:hypothetical protein
MDRLSLSAMLSHLLVAFTIEFDNEAERQMRHRTTRRGLSDHEPTPDSLHAPWLVSLVMWSNCMRFLSDKGVTVRQLADLARTSTNINGMERWGYVVIEPDPADKRPKPPRSQWLIRPDRRWQEGGGTRSSLSALLSQVLLAFALEFERQSDLSLAISANVLRVLGETGVQSETFRC